MKKRLFIAINPAAELATQLGYLLDQLRELTDLKVVPKDQLHLTLAFLGDIEEARIPRLASLLDQLARSTPPFIFTVQPPALLINHDTFRGVWLLLTPNPALEQLAADLRTGLRQSGFTLDAKPFNGHITLARAKTDRPGPALTQWLADWHSSTFPATAATALVLYSSKLTPAGPVHSIEYHTQL